MEYSIKSVDNPKIKAITKLQKGRERKISGKILIEGRREIGLALSSGINLESLFYCPDFYKDKLTDFKIEDSSIFPVTPAVFKKISYRENPDGLIAVAEPEPLVLDDIRLNSLPLIIILEAVEKPGNLGAILRTADAAGADAVVIADPHTDIYNPNVIRASQGTVFSNQVVSAASEEILSWLKKNNIRIMSAAPDSDKTYTGSNYNVPTAIVMGTENKGLSGFWLKNSDEKIRIPMKGKIDSLNVSVSTAILVFEALRQRSKK